MKRFPGVIRIALAFQWSIAVALGNPFEDASIDLPGTEIDRLVAERHREMALGQAPMSSDSTFLRRVYLDFLGDLPNSFEVIRFTRSKDPEKRAKLIDRLLDDPRFVDYWTLKWCDLLRVKSEFPINLWPNGVQAYHRWIRQAVQENRPFNVFARELLTASGSNYRDPAVNFYRAAPGQSSRDLAKVAALTFMGTRLESWEEAEQARFANIFSRVAFKRTAEWKEELVFLDPSHIEPMEIVFPDGKTQVVRSYEDPRFAFADWLTSSGNPWFARALVNRAWSWFFGRGIVHEPDDLRRENPPSIPALLVYLEGAFLESGYNIKSLFRLIANSRTYQQSSIIAGSNPEMAVAHFACYPIRRLEAEVIIDLLNRFTGQGESYSSPIPEPFTFVPEYERTVQLADGSISSSFLEMFGRPRRDSGLESERDHLPTDAQRLYLLNSAQVQGKIANSQWLKRTVARERGKPRMLVGAIYVNLLSRAPSSEEVDAVLKHFGSKGSASKQAAEDLAWALVNTKEFLYKH